MLYFRCYKLILRAVKFIVRRNNQLKNVNKAKDHKYFVNSRLYLFLAVHYCSLLFIPVKIFTEYVGGRGASPPRVKIVQIFHQIITDYYGVHDFYCETLICYIS